jgi:hypothetical protein
VGGVSVFGPLNLFTNSSTFSCSRWESRYFLMSQRIRSITKIQMPATMTMRVARGEDPNPAPLGTKVGVGEAKSEKSGVGET